MSQCIKTRMWISINFTLQMLTICTCHIGDAPNNERQLYTEINGKKIDKSSLIKAWRMIIFLSKENASFFKMCFLMSMIYRSKCREAIKCTQCESFQQLVHLVSIMSSWWTF